MKILFVFFAILVFFTPLSISAQNNRYTTPTVTGDGAPNFTPSVSKKEATQYYDYTNRRLWGFANGTWEQKSAEFSNGKPSNLIDQRVKFCIDTTTNITYVRKNGVWKNTKGFIDVKDFGAKGDGLTIDVVAIQAAIDFSSANGGGTVNFSEGTYLISTTPIQPRTGVNLKGIGKNSVLKFSSAGFGSLIRSNTTVQNVIIDGLSFDGSNYYPANSTINPATVPDYHGVFLIDCSNIEIKNCYFQSIPRSAVTIATASVNAKNIKVLNNTFNKGGYSSKVIDFLCSGGFRASNIQIIGNSLNENGPQQYYDPSDDSYLSSKDGISIDECDYVTISDNTVKNCGGTAIRSEQSEYVEISKNIIENCGQTGITFYYQSAKSTCTGNKIVGWGKIPPANAIRNFGGVYYYAKEYVGSTPSSPVGDARFEIYPYALTGVNAANIRAWTIGTPLYPHRGYAAISITHESNSIVVSDNVAQGILTQTSGKYDYASDFSYTPVHNVNGGTDNNGINCTVTNNKFSNSRVFDVYQPRAMNPISGGGVNGGKTFFSLLEGTTKFIENTFSSSNYQHASTFNVVNVIDSFITAKDVILNGVNVGKGGGSQSQNLRVGLGALSGNTTGNLNTALGYNALAINTTGAANTAIGNGALTLNNQSNITALGYNAGYSNTGSTNTFIGTFAGLQNTSGSSNTMTGYDALRNNQTGNFNVAFGRSALLANVVSDNLAIGYQSLSQNTTGAGNIGIGKNAGNTLVTGSNNILIGNNVTTPTNATSNFLSLNDWIFGDGGKIGIGTNTPQYRLEIYSPEGKPLKLHGLQQGASNDSIVSELNGEFRRLAMSDLIGAGAIKVSNQAVNIPSITGMNNVSGVNVTVTGATIGQTVTINPRTDITTSNIILIEKYVSSANTLTLKFMSLTIGTNGGFSANFDITLNK